MKVIISTKWNIVLFARKYFYHLLDTFRPTSLKTLQFCKYNKKNEQRKMKKQFHCTLFETYKCSHYLSFRDIKIFKEQKMEIFRFFVANLITQWRRKKEKKKNQQFFYQKFWIFFIIHSTFWMFRSGKIFNGRTIMDNLHRMKCNQFPRRFRSSHTNHFRARAVQKRINLRGWLY